MPRQSQALKKLRDNGVRLTPQRMLILSAVVDGQGHMGVDEILKKAKESYPYIDIATVYRTLHLFTKVGVVTEVAMGDRLHFELTDPESPHHHMVCKKCGSPFDLSPRYLEELRQTLVSEFGFEPDLDNFTITGMCADCIKAEKSKSNQDN